MICEACEGEGYVRGSDPANPGALVMLPCLECNGSGIASCCDAAGSAAPKPFVCPRCFAVSHNTHDSVYRYCGRCHVFVDDAPAPAADPYRDARFPPRRCDHCEKLYQGPAVYCSLECAIADA